MTGHGLHGVHALARRHVCASPMVLCVADAIFEDPRPAEIYDPLDPGRSDLAAYVAMAEEFSAVAVLDVGCATDAPATPGQGRRRDRLHVRP
jgi:hypothetical protein